MGTFVSMAAPPKSVKLAQRFQKDPTLRVAVLAITAAGVALTLTAAATVYFAEMFWTLGRYCRRMTVHIVSASSTRSRSSTGSQHR